MAGLQVNVYVAISVTWTAATTALLLRLKARRMTRMKLWFDDYLACVAWVRSYVLSLLVVTDTYRRLFRDIILLLSFV